MILIVILECKWFGYQVWRKEEEDENEKRYVV